MSKKIVEEAIQYLNVQTFHRDDFDSSLADLYEVVNELHSMALGAEFEGGEWEMPQGNNLVDDLGEIMDLLDLKMSQS
jgi:hypothetical protein